LVGAGAEGCRQRRAVKVVLQAKTIGLPFKDG
jgi:hypothetical protein